MKAFILTDHFGCGGAERVASLIIKGLTENNLNEVHVCVFEDANNYSVNKDKVFFHLLSSPNKSHFINTFLKILNLVKLIYRIKPEIIYSFGPIMAGYVYIAKLLSGHKSLKVIDSERNDPRFEPVQNWKKKIRNYCYSRADILVCQTPMAVKILEETYGVKCKKIIIPNPITPNLPLWQGWDSKKIITAARLTEQKNLPMLIDAFEMIHKDFSEYKLIIYGEGELRKMLTEYIDKKGLKDFISLPGFAKDIHKIMSESYMYVSSSDYEGISNSMLEALGIGLPCVCTNCPVGGAEMFINHGVNGLLSPVGDSETLSKNMRSLIIDMKLSKKISSNSRSVNEQLSLNKITEKWMSLANK